MDCMDAFQLIPVIKDFSIDYEILCIKLDIEKTRLLQWAEGVGLLADETHWRHNYLLSPQILPQIERILKGINLLLTRTDDFISLYGLRDNQNGPSNGNISFVGSRRLQSISAAYAQN